MASVPLDAKTKILYGVGEIANGIKMVAFALFTLFFYTTVMGLPSSWVGFASLVALVWNAAIDPYIGVLSDNARTRFGRRHSFMLAGALTMGVAFWAYWSPPAGLSRPALLAWLLVTSVLVRATTAVYGVPYYALGAELSADYSERTAVTAVRGALSLVGVLLAASLSFLVFFPDKTPGVDPKLDYAGYPAMGLTFGAVMTIVGLIATFGTLGRRPYLATGGAGAHGDPASRRFSISFVQCFKNPSFVVVFASFSLFFLGVVINGALSLYYLTYYAQITSSRAVSGCQVAFYVGGLVGALTGLAIARSVDKRRLYLGAALATSVVMAASLVLVGDGRMFGVGNALVLIVGHGLAGLFSSTIWFLPGSMIADVADEDDLSTGQRREGAFFGIFLFGQQLAAGISALVAGVLLDWFAGLAPGQATQSPVTVYRIAVLYGLVPAVLVAAAGFLILGYSLSRQRVASIQAALAERGAASPDGARSFAEGGGALPSAERAGHPAG